MSWRRNALCPVRTRKSLSRWEITCGDGGSTLACSSASSEVPLPEGEHKRVHSRIEKLDLERSVNDRLRLPNQLIQPRFSDLPGPLWVEVETMGGTGHFTLHAYPESDRTSGGGRPHDQVKIPGMKPIPDLP